MLRYNGDRRDAYTTRHTMGWLRLVGSLKVQVSFAKEPYKRDDILQKRPIILRRLLIVATPYHADLHTHTHTITHTHTHTHAYTIIHTHTYTHTLPRKLANSLGIDTTIIWVTTQTQTQPQTQTQTRTQIQM